MDDNYKKLREKLTELFQLDQAELDFGIYRIMNAKRIEIEHYLDKDLQQQVKKILSLSDDRKRSDLQNELKEAKEAAITIGVPPDDAPKVQQIMEKLKGELDLGTLEQEIFSALYNFFSRYYEGGDFISLRRYKKNVYAIPYEGEEVKLHWANSDQYYIKSAEYFNNYRFKLDDGKSVEFCLRGAETEQNDNQGKDRRFVLHEFTS